MHSSTQEMGQLTEDSASHSSFGNSSFTTLTLFSLAQSWWMHFIWVRENTKLVCGVHQNTGEVVLVQLPTNSDVVHLWCESSTTSVQANYGVYSTYLG